MSTMLVFPEALYPAFAPLSVPMANHLLLQEEKLYRHRPRMRPPDEELFHTVLERIVRARSIIFEYLNPFVLADKKRQQRGESRAFPTSQFLLETLAEYTPQGVRNAEVTLDHWQQRGLLRREKSRGLLDITSVAALLVSRISEGKLQKNWLPSSVDPAEPLWWCYSRPSPSAPAQPHPLPFTFQETALLLWTPWRGSMWEESWRGGEESSDLYRWGGSPTLQDLLAWDREIAQKILNLQHDPLLGRKRVQRVLLEEAQHDILACIATGSMV